MAIQILNRRPVLDENHSAGIGQMNMQIVLDASLLLARRLDQCERGGAQSFFLTGLGFQISNYSYNGFGGPCSFIGFTHHRMTHFTDPRRGGGGGGGGGEKKKKKKKKKKKGGETG